MTAGGHQRGSKWTPEHLQRLADYIDEAHTKGRRPYYEIIGAELGHPPKSCRTMMAHIRAKRHNDKIKDGIRLVQASIAYAEKMRQRVRREEGATRSQIKERIRTLTDMTDHMHATSTAKLLQGAELRSRDGNWFGDPPAGRSALDKKRLAEINQPGTKSPSFAPLASASTESPRPPDADATFSKVVS